MKKIMFLIISVSYICDVFGMQNLCIINTEKLANVLSKDSYCGNVSAVFTAAKNIAILIKVNEDARNRIMALLQQSPINAEVLSEIFRVEGELPRALPCHVEKWAALKADPNAKYRQMIALLREAGNYEHAIFLIRDTVIATKKQQLDELLKDAAFYRVAFAYIIAADSKKCVEVIYRLQHIDTYCMAQDFMRYYQDILRNITSVIAENIRFTVTSKAVLIPNNSTTELRSILKQCGNFLLRQHCYLISIIENLADDIISDKHLFTANSREITLLRK